MDIAICLLISTGFLALVFAISRTQAGAAKLCAASGGILCLALMLGLFVLMFQCALSFVAGLACLLFRAKPEVVFVSAAFAAVASYAVAIWLDHNDVQRLAKLRDRYPFESVSARLDYERRRQPDTSPSNVPLSQEAEVRLNEFETDRVIGSARAYMLAALHNRTRERFFMAFGFGNRRMMRVREESISLARVEPIPLPQPPYQPQPDFVDKRTNPLTDTPAQEQLQSLHTSGLHDFLDRERMGHVEDRDHVAGFQSHAFQTAPKVDAAATEQEWQVTRLELVSLLKHDVPVAYVSEHLPRMEQLRNAPTRPLDEFETRSLDQVRRSEDLVVETGINRIRMLGSLRAAKDCLECHTGERGDLLGAFSYDLFRLRPKPVPKQETPASPRV